MTPFRSRDTLEEWLDEFRALGYPVAGTIRTVPQDGADGAHTGLVAVTLANASTVGYVQPETPGSTQWVVTLEARDHPVALSAPVMLNLASELTMLSSLCAFLQAKSQAFVGQDTA